MRNWDVRAGDIVRPPRGTTLVVLDTPAGLHGKRLDAVLIPLQASLFDIQATHDLVNGLRAHMRAAHSEMVVVGMGSVAIAQRGQEK